MILSEKLRAGCRKSIHAVPTLFTFLNAVFGFLAIIKALEGSVTAASYCIMLAALMDACDGRLARALRVTSCFGAELDSLSDAISFCLAPVVLVYCWYPTPIGFVGMTILGLYLCAGLGRLARFNSKANNTLPYSVGLTTTISAFTLATMPTSILMHQKITLGIVLALALLMPSTVRFPLFKKRLKIHAPVWVALAGAVIVWSMLALKGYPMIFMSIVAFIGTFVIYAFYRSWLVKRALLFLFKRVY